MNNQPGESDGINAIHQNEDQSIAPNFFLSCVRIHPCLSSCRVSGAYFHVSLMLHLAVGLLWPTEWGWKSQIISLGWRNYLSVLLLLERRMCHRCVLPSRTRDVQNYLNLTLTLEPRTGDLCTQEEVSVSWFKALGFLGCFCALPNTHTHTVWGEDRAPKSWVDFFLVQ